MDPIKLINNTFHVNLGSWTPIQSHAQNGNAGVGSSHSTSAPKAPHTAAPTANSGAHASPRDTVQLGHGHQEPDYNPRQLRERFGAKPASAEWAKECQTPTRPTSAPPTRPTSAPPTRPTSAPPTGPSSTPPTGPSSAPPTRPTSAPPTGPSSTPPTRPTSAPPTPSTGAPPTRPSSTPPAQKPVLPPQPPHSQKPATIHETPAAPPSRPSGPSFGQRVLGATQRVLGATQRLFGAAGVVLSGLQVKTGIEQLMQGDTANGVANVGGGGANGTAGVLAMMGRTTGALRAGGAGAIIDGVNNVVQGQQSGNTYRTVEGGAKTAAGVAMLSGTAAAGPAAVGYLAYTGTRAGMSIKVSGDKTTDDLLSNRMDMRLNVEENHVYAGMNEKRRNAQAVGDQIAGMSVEQMKAANLDRDVVSRAIDGELQHSEDCRAVGDVEGAQRSAERLTGFRAQQARVRAVYGDQPFAQ